MFSIHGSSMAQRQNYLDLDPTYKDAWGLPLLRMTFDFPKNDLRMAEYVTGKAVEIGKAMGAKQVAGNPRKGPYTVTQYQTTHNTGGTVMGDNRETSVVNRYLQCWDVPNVFVVGASVFPQNRELEPDRDRRCADVLDDRCAEGTVLEEPATVGVGMSKRTWASSSAIAAMMLLPAAGMAAEPNGGGDATSGAKLAIPCQACHGAKGEGMVGTNAPRLAAQDSYYLDKQLRDYASGTRNDPIMSPMAKTLNDQQRLDVSVYFASLPPPPAQPPSNGDAKLLARGHLLSRTGDESKQLQACGNCHGPDGRGEKFAAPYLDGQLAVYLTKAIATWKDGTRKNDGGEIMAVVAARLDESDIAAISAYFSTLPTPRP